MKQPRELHFVVVVWGESYCRTFLEISLPTQLSPGNLPGLRHPQRAVFRIFTSDADVDRVQSSGSYQVLARHVRAEIETFDASEREAGDKKYSLMTRLHLRALRDAMQRDAVVVFLSPDHVVADGSFAALERLSDRPAVMIAAPRLRLASLAPELRERYFDPNSGAIGLPRRQLVTLAMKHLHHVIEASFWGRRWFTSYPSVLYWRLGEQGMLAHCFHLHPLLVDPAKLASGFGERMESTIDGDLLPALQVAPDEIYVVTDSDEVLLFEVSDDTIEHGLVSRKEHFTEPDVVDWMRVATNSLHRGFATYPVWFHSCEPSALRAYDDIAARAEALVSKLLHDAQIPPPTPVPPRHRGPVRHALRVFERTLRRSIWRRSRQA